jgi:hypothetical protein
MPSWTSPLDFIDEQNWPAPKMQAAPQSNWFTAGAKAGLHDQAMGLGGTAQWAGKLTGIGPLERAGQAVADSQTQAAAEERPDLNIPPWREGGAPVLPWLGYQAVRNAPYIAATALASRFVPAGMVPAALERAGAYIPEFMGGGGARLGAEAGEAALAKGADFAHTVTAGAIAGAPMAIGSMQQEVNERVANGGDPYTWGEAASIGAKALPYSAIEALGPAQAFGIAKQLRSARSLADVGKIALKGVVAGAVEEMPQEAVQTAMEQAHRTDLSAADKAQNIIDGALTGAAVGGVFGGVAGGVSGTRSIMHVPASNVDTEHLEASTAEVEPGAVPPAEAAAPAPEAPVAPPVEQPVAPAAPTTITSEAEPELPLGIPPAQEAVKAPTITEYLAGASGRSGGQAKALNLVNQIDPNYTPDQLDEYLRAHVPTNWQSAKTRNGNLSATQNMLIATGTVDNLGRTRAEVEAEITKVENRIKKNSGLANAPATKNSLKRLNGTLAEMDDYRSSWMNVVSANQKGTTNGLSSETSRPDAGPDVNAPGGVASSPLGEEVAVPAEGRQAVIEQGQVAVPTQGQIESSPVEGQGQVAVPTQGRIESAPVEGPQLSASESRNGVSEQPAPAAGMRAVPEVGGAITLDDMFPPEDTPTKSTFDVAGEADPLAGKSEKARRLIEQSRAFEEAKAQKQPFMGEPTEQTMQDAALEDLVRKGATANQVFDHIASMTDKPEYKDLTSALKRYKVNPAIEFAKSPPRAEDFHWDPVLATNTNALKASYDEAQNRVEIYKNTDMHHAVLHEAVHSATMNAINADTHFAQKMTGLYEVARKAIGFPNTVNTYGLRNVKEFVAESFTNPDLRQVLRDTKSDGSKRSVWDKIKDAVFTMLRLPKRSRSLLDDVMDAGDNLMRENAAFSKSSIEHMDGVLRGAKYGLEGENEAVKTTTTFARRAVDKLWSAIDPNGGLSTRLAIQRGLLSASSWGHVAEHFDSLFGAKKGGEGPLHELARGQQFQNTFKAHLGDLFRSAMSKWTMAHPRAKEIINHFAYLSSLKVNPKVKPDAHTWLTTEEHGRVDDIIRDANKQYAELKSIKGGVDAYDAAIAHNEVQEFAVIAMMLDRQMRTGELYSSLTDKFPEKPEDEFAKLPALHNNILEANAFWREAMKERLDAIDEKEKQVNALLGKTSTKPTPEQKRMREVFDREKVAMHNLVSTAHQKDTAAGQYPYFHLMRDGDSFVAFKLKRLEKNGPIDPAALAEVQKAFEKANVFIEAEQNQDQVFMRFPSEYEALEAHKLALDLKARDLIDTSKEAAPAHGYRTDAPPTYILTNQQVKQATDAIRASFNPPDNASPEVIKMMSELENHVVTEFRNYLIDMMPDMAMAKVNIKRENKPGFSKDMEKAFARRAHIGVNALSNIAASDKITTALDNMKNAIAKKEAGDKVFVMQNVFREAMLRQLNHAKASAVDGNLVDVGRAVNSFWHLAFSPSYALINSAQVFVLLWPELSKHMGYAKAGKAVTSVMPEAMKILSEALKAGIDTKAITDEKSDVKQRAAALGLSILRSSDAGITQSVLEKAYGVDKASGKELGEREQEVLAAALRGGIDLNSAARELARVSEGLSDKSMDAIFRVGASFGQYSETFTRLVAALSAYDTYKSDPKIAKLSGKKNVGDYIDHVIKQSMLDYAETNTARGIGRYGWAGPLSPLMFSFMNYQFQVLEKLYREMHTAIGLQKDFSPEQQTAARRFLLGHAVVLTAMTGTLGLPAAGMLAGMVNRLKELFGDDKDVRENYREFLADVFGKDVGEIIAHGAPTALGASISKRAGEQDIIPFTGIMDSRQKFLDGTKDWAFSMGGAPLSAIANFITGSKEIADGNMLEGAIKAAPVFAKGPLKAYQMTRDGYVDAKGNKLPMDAGARDILFTLLGVIPSEKAEYQEQRKFAADRKGLEMTRGTNIRNHIVSAIEAGDTEKAQQWLLEANALAQRNPERDIRPTIQSSLSRRARERAMSEMTHTPLGLSPKRGMVGTDYANWGVGQ